MAASRERRESSWPTMFRDKKARKSCTTPCRAKWEILQSDWSRLCFYRSTRINLAAKRWRSLTDWQLVLCVAREALGWQPSSISGISRRWNFVMGLKMSTIICILHKTGVNCSNSVFFTIACYIFSGSLLVLWSILCSFWKVFFFALLVCSVCDASFVFFLRKSYFDLKYRSSFKRVSISLHTVFDSTQKYGFCRFGSSEKTWGVCWLNSYAKWVRKRLGKIVAALWMWNNFIHVCLCEIWQLFYCFGFHLNCDCMQYYNIDCFEKVRFIALFIIFILLKH